MVESVGANRVGSSGIFNPAPVTEQSRDDTKARASLSVSIRENAQDAPGTADLLDELPGSTLDLDHDACALVETEVILRAPIRFFVLSSASRNALRNSGVPGLAVFSASGMAFDNSLPASQAWAPKVDTLPGPYAASYLVT